MEILPRILIGLIFSALIGYAAFRRDSLTGSGVLGAVLVGTLIFGFGGWAWGLTLITFFVTSSLLSHYKEAQKEHLAEKFEKGQRRDLWQALANGGMGAVISVIYWRTGNPLLAAAFIGAMATVNADTWATELGVLSKSQPRLITTGKPVEPGTSGGVSLAGTGAALAGALVIGLAVTALGIGEFWLTGTGRLPLITALSAAVMGGLGGSLIDSLIGATVQAQYHCPRCDKDTEKAVHSCGTPANHVRGWRWLNNDWVNFLASVAGALIGVGVGVGFLV
jgi:uncharacterized protein (TIGR00297 family)